MTIPAFPDALADWDSEASSDYKALAALLRPHMAEPVKAGMDWNFGLRDRDPKLHWALAPVGICVGADLFTSLMVQMDGVLGSSEWGPFKARVTCDETKWFARVMGEEILRIRAQPGSGWDEEEAKRIVKEQLGMRKEAVKVGT